MTDDVEPGPNIRGSNYEYKVGLGTVMGRDSVSWDGWYRCNTWTDAERLIGVWHDSKDYPAVRVDIHYTGDRP